MKGCRSIIKIALHIVILSCVIVLGIIGYRLLVAHTIDAIWGIIIFLCITGVLVWSAIVVKRPAYAYIKPSFKLTGFIIMGLFLLFAFAGIQPLAGYKDKVMAQVTSSIGGIREVSKSGANIFLSTPPVAVVSKMLPNVIPTNSFDVYLVPTQLANAKIKYNVDLYEKGKFRARTTISWNQPELNVSSEKYVLFRLNAEEYNAYSHASWWDESWWKSIFSVEIYEP